MNGRNLEGDVHQSLIQIGMKEETNFV